MGRKMEWAARGSHLGGIPRKMVFMAVGAFAKAVATVFNTTSVHNADTLFRLVRSRPPGVPLITIGRPSYVGIQWISCSRCKFGTLHTFPEGKVFQEDTAIKRLKWGTASLIVRAPITPIVLPIVHHGFEGVMPENFWFGRRPPVPLFNKNIKIIIGEPVEFDFTELRRLAMAMSGDSSFREGGGSGKGCTGGGGGGSSSSAHGLDEAAQRCLYTIISERIRSVMERLRTYGKTLRKP
ncbi:N-acylphosphatidylethanolamine synthase isoform X3 [Malania oleifera]|uniref:N-acylphosphatidylethanolamine synthase isoform X3 n=1 Tax=Malania oleifera TaxID=397392 RepID=UPI0025AEAA8A|nr:N-acylphosphatidylethanolamine synthase isoform X3 [Malania oleifera]